MNSPSSPVTRNASLLRILAIFAAALLVPGLPLLILGETFELRLGKALSAEWPPLVSFLAVTFLLSSDLLLPVPSSAVSTYAGSVLGVPFGGFTVWLGMTLGAVIGFAVSRFAGPALLKKLAAPEDVARLHGLSHRYGSGLLIVTRPLPLLAEAAVVLTGSAGLTWREFLLPICVSNAVIAFGYVLLGSLVEKGTGLLLALTVSIVIPLSATFLVRSWLPVRDESKESAMQTPAVTEEKS